MSLRTTIFLGTCGLCLFADNPAQAEPDSDLFAAMIMTKRQQASSYPTDSGVLLHQGTSDSWERIGPKIMIIFSAVADPSDPDTIFFAAGNGIVRTQDGGESWRLVTSWSESDALQIAIDPEDGSNVYAATAWGVNVSRDGGDTWADANQGLPEYFSKGIVLDERKPNRLLLATTTGLFESKNRAKSWKRVKSFPEVAVLRLRRSASNPNTWIAGTEGQGVWISTDDARTWRRVADALANANVYAVAIDPMDESNLAAGAWGTGVYLSRDGGVSWSMVSEAFPSPNITAAIFDVTVPHRLWASTFEEGTLYSDDFGESWTSANLDGAYVFDLGFLPSRQ